MKSIRRKLTLSYFLLAAITLALTGALLFVTTRFLARQIESDSLRETAGDLLPRMQMVLQSEDDPARIDEFIRLAESLGNVDLRFVGPEGEVDAGTLFADRVPREIPGVGGSPRLRPPSMHPDLGRVIDRFMMEDAGRMLDARMANAPRGTIRIGLADGRQNSYLEIADRTDLSGRLTRLTLFGFLISAAATLGASTAIGMLVGSNLTKPILHLTSAIETMQDGELDARVHVTTNDEIGTLGNQFNQMADKLSLTIHQLRDERDNLRVFMADASHELRTPLTAMTTFVELLQTEGVAENQIELLTEMHTQAQRMGRTVADLLLLSRLEGGVAGAVREAAMAGEIVEHAWANVGRLTPGKQVAFALTDKSRPEIPLIGDSKELVTLFENLFANSLHAIAGTGRVECRITDGDSVRVFRVIDDGTGIPADDLPRIFDRFFRSADSGREGSGLGLSISQSIARAHGGSIHATSPPEGRSHGTEMTVMLPLSG